MHWTRREFLQISGAAAVAGLMVPLAVTPGMRAYFSDWRALPGMKLRLTLEMPDPGRAQVSIIARSEGHERVIETLAGSPEIEVEMPYIETSEESFEILAVVDSGMHRCMSDAVEVLAPAYQFGL